MLTLWNADPMLASVDRVFDDVMRSALGPSGAATNPSPLSPAVDVRMDDEKIVLVCDLPGMSKDDVEITLHERVLTIKGERKFESKENERVLLGRAYGSFSCSYTLPEGVDDEKLTADLAQGVLTVTVPKHPETKPRRIAVGSPSGAKRLDP